MDIILSTGNPSKAAQAKAVFADSAIRLLTLNEMNIIPEDVEDGTTLEENSYKKAFFAHEKSDGRYWTIADDTGLFINALDGEPGIRTARWAGDVPTEVTMRYCLERMNGIVDRSAIFRTVVVAISPSGEHMTFTGEVNGTILEASRVAPRPSMPYSAIFVPEGQRLSWAEMSIEQENKISHRGQVFRKARAALEKIISAAS